MTMDLDACLFDSLARPVVLRQVAELSNRTSILAQVRARLPTRYSLYWNVQCANIQVSILLSCSLPSCLRDPLDTLHCIIDTYTEY